MTIVTLVDVAMQILKEEYLFYEWVILGKGLSQEQLESMNDNQFVALIDEYKEFVRTLN